MITTDEYGWFVDRTLEKMTDILRELGDDLVNLRPNLPGANAPYAIVTHCLGVVGMWGGHYVAGREVIRDRDAEFLATGRVDDLVRRVGLARDQLRSDVATADMSGALRRPAAIRETDVPYARTQGAALLHIYEELAQHLGHLELSRDIILAAR